ncbi:erv26 super protein [Coemansia asiatica]|uniref:Erv26 super protein n=1 Tax=Coemansia asiatica TaxID=1052880 RepID=A0A9W7XCZ8_9FUNG|nr:erv26 super protein [Coemansia asiatica]KAJ2881745.1 erv26 super protein [Coemansia asiatica]
MALVLELLAKLGAAVGLIFAVFCIACGLYIVSEWVEECPRQARKTIQLAAWILDGVLVLALLDGLSIWRTAVSVCANHVYLQNLQTFPLVSLSGPVFIVSCVLAIANHFMWFFYFVGSMGYSFGQVCAFMLFCVWLVPLALFVSLMPVDSALPSACEGGGKSRQNMFRSLFAGLLRSAGDQQLPQQGLHSD